MEAESGYTSICDTIDFGAPRVPLRSNVAARNDAIPKVQVLFAVRAIRASSSNKSMPLAFGSPEQSAEETPRRRQLPLGLRHQLQRLLLVVGHADRLPVIAFPRGVSLRRSDSSTAAPERSLTPYLLSRRHTPPDCERR